MSNQPYTIADIQALITKIKAFDDASGLPPPHIDHLRVYRLLFETIKDLRQRVATLESKVP